MVNILTLYIKSLLKFEVFKMKNLFTLLLTGLTVLSFYSCDKNDDEGTDGVENAAVISNYADLVAQAYQAAYDDAVALQTAIDAFVADPTEANMTAAKDAWLQARESYGPTEAFRFAQGPIDIIDGEEGPEGLLNSWPLDENYIDYVDGASDAGIINDPVTFPTIDKALLESLNGEGGEENVSVGYHAIEFLLWGQDITSPESLEAGKRPYTDYVDGGTADNQDRRGAYLKICAELLIDHLDILVKQWNANGAYRSTFLALNENEALGNMLTAIATLSKSELAGERIFTAYDNQDQEDEHSCFSDNTHRDIRLNFDGIKQVYLGIKGTETGASIHDLIEQENADLAAAISAQLDLAETAVYATGTPFDFAIVDGNERPKVLESVTALRTLGDKFVEGGAAIGLTVGTDIP